MSNPLAPERRKVSTIVTALFPDRASAELGWDVAIARGYKPSDISAVLSPETHKKVVSDEAPPAGDFKGAGLGGAIGTPVGALAAVLIAVGSVLVLPGVGLVLAGPIIAAYAGAGAGGAIVGGIIGAMIGAEIEEHRVKMIEEHVKRGGFVLTVRAQSLPDADAIETDWKQVAAEVIR
ncbi:MAG: hypothetical protein FD180_3316 [Planctomycetota bacterium]|nr:MAG: hypothetical protein FD180_3316 [Planctomycetota bacterium]